MVTGSRTPWPPGCASTRLCCAARRTRQSTYREGRGQQATTRHSARRALKHLRVQPESTEPEQLVSRRFVELAAPKSAHKRPFIDRASAVEEREPSSSSWRLARRQRSARQGCCGRRPPPILPTREGQRAGELCKEPNGMAAGRSKRLRAAPNGVRDAPARAFGDSPRVHAVR